MIRAVPEFALLFTVEDTPVTTDTNRPLWRKMEVAYSESEKPGGVENWLSEHGYAAEIRAIADELQERRSNLETGYNLRPEGIIAWLRAEADRAEAGVLAVAPAKTPAEAGE